MVQNIVEPRQTLPILANVLMESEGKTVQLTATGALREGTWFGDDGKVAADARVEPPSVVGADVELQARAHVGPRAVIGERSRIGAGARVEEAVLWEWVEVGARVPARVAAKGAITVPLNGVLFSFQGKAGREWAA